AAGEFPRDRLRMLGEVGMLGLPYPEEYGGSGQPYEVYLQVLEELASAWMTVGLAVSVHVMSLYPLATFGTEAQRTRYLPDLVGGQRLGAYALSEAQAGSDIAGMTTRAKPGAEGFDISGAKAWITHGGVADFYTTFVRTGEDGSGLSCFHLPAPATGLSFGTPEHKMGLTASPTTALYFDAVHVGDDQLLGPEGQGMKIALAALDSGRLGIAACATGLAQAALDLAVGYAKERVQFGRPIAEFQGCTFLLAEMAAAVDTARACYLLGARKRDAGMSFTRDAAVAKMVATDTAMKVTTDAVQVLGGYGYTRDFPAERYMREAKVTQIFEGTNQIQRLVIGRQLLRTPSGGSGRIPPGSNS
ncbi:MAG TPA: acyl-CoA dehydrogenase family protein, partial [Propionibacteriaceae bacterium]|nr:acyl-CoA dehydrogenase family protein [Propionibacteriaceae bacterium]